MFLFKFFKKELIQMYQEVLCPQAEWTQTGGAYYVR